MASKSLKRITSVWIITLLALFVLAIIFGITMRFGQGDDINLAADKFYSLMTAHGITMVGIWAAAGLVGIHYILTRYITISATSNVIAYIFTVVGVLLLWVATFMGRFHAGWTFLYPLPFKIAWAEWATPVFLSGLVVLGLGWLIWSSAMLRGIFSKYSLKETFAWQHFKKNPETETPPFILISTVSLIGIIVSLLTAVVLLALLFAEYFAPESFVNDALLVKNLTYFFGHTLANESLYLGLAVVYELMPEVSGREKLYTTWYVALGWNMTLIFILTAYLHHMYMDFVQPEGFQIVGQLASYFASLPAAAVTMVSVILLVLNRKIKWSLTNLLFFVGTAGWAVGGIGAVIDATISNNMILHNTLWVPGHFHDYNVLGAVLFSLGFFYWFANEVAGTQDKKESNKLRLSLIIVGGAGFLLMFYFAGAMSVPRRFNVYPDEFTYAKLLASAGAWFAILYLLGILIIFGNIIKKCTKAFTSSS